MSQESRNVECDNFQNGGCTACGPLQDPKFIFSALDADDSSKSFQIVGQQFSDCPARTEVGGISTLPSPADLPRSISQQADQDVDSGLNQDRIVVCKHLASGAYGDVYLAKYEMGSKFYTDVSLKMPRKLDDRNNNGDGVGSLKYEIEVLREVRNLDNNHDHIVRLLFAMNMHPANVHQSAAHNPKQPISVMSFHPGKNLLQHIMDTKVGRGTFEDSHIYTVLHQMSSALKHMRDKWRYYHCDVKPANVVYNKDSQLSALVDLGLSAKIKSDNGIERCSQGSPLYMSPEVHGMTKNGLSLVMPKSDVYSLGMTAKHLKTLHEPCENHYKSYHSHHHSKVLCITSLSCEQCELHMKSSDKDDPLVIIIQKMIYIKHDTRCDFDDVIHDAQSEMKKLMEKRQEEEDDETPENNIAGVERPLDSETVIQPPPAPSKQGPQPPQ